MTKKNITPYGLWLLVSLALLLIASMDQSTKDALKVQHVLKTIENHTPGDKGSSEVTERELNAYIGYRLEREKDTLVRSLKVQLLGEDRIRGNLRLDARRLNLGMLLGDDLVFDFKGRVMTRKNLIRLDLEPLSLNGRTVQPMMLDILLKALSMYHGQEIGGVDDWYKLPKGVDQVRVDDAKAVLFYI